MRILSRLKREYLQLGQRLKWNSAARAIKRKEIISNAVCRKNTQRERTLVIAPHPDDELIGCHQVLREGNVAIYYTGLTGYDTSIHNRKTRLCELTGYSKRFGNTLYVDEPGETSVLKRLLNDERYDCIFIPSYVDWHWEHRKVCREALELLSGLGYTGFVAFYMVTVPIPAYVVNCYSAADGDKWKTFRRYYPSQSNMPLERFMAVQNSYGTAENTGVEPYWRINGDQIRACLDGFKDLGDNELDCLKERINDLMAVRQRSKAVYDRIVI